VSDTPGTQEAVERWRQGKINIFDEMARMERERDEANEELDKQLIRYDALFDEAEKIRIERDEARRLLAAAKESLNVIHVEVGGWIAAMMKEGK